MNRCELLLLALGLWTALGVAGTFLSWVRGERAKTRRGALWIVGIWTIYLVAEFAVARMQKQRIITFGQRKCFDEMCFSIGKVEEVSTYSGRNKFGDGTKLLRVSVLIENKGRGRPQSEGLLRAYLVDGSDHTWTELPGLGGVPLTAMVPAAGTVISQPVFKVPLGMTRAGLVLTHGRRQPGVLVIGDSDSLGHRPDVFALGGDR